MKNYLAIDLETTGLSTKDDIHCIGYCNDDLEGVLRWDADSMVQLEDWLDRGYILMSHHAAFDKRMIEAHLGRHIPPSQFLCTEVLAHAVNPQLDSYSLDSLSGGEKIDYGARMIAEGLWDGKNKADLYRIPYNPIMVEYCLKDTKLCWAQWKKYLPHLEKDERLANGYFNTLVPFIDVVISMDNGIEVDAQALMTLLQEINGEINELTSSFIQKYPSIPKLKWDKESKMWTATGKYTHPSLSSPSDVTCLLLTHKWEPDDYTEAGRPKTTQAVLDRLVASVDTPPQLKEVASAIKEIRTATGVQTQCITWLEIITATGSTRVRPNWHQTGTKTSRMSSSKPNCQNLAVRHKRWGARVRSCFVPPVGYSMLIGDLSQIELCVLAYYLEVVCEDDSMADGARKGIDAHTNNTTRWLKVNVGDESFDLSRKKMKNGIFCTNYGGGAKRLSLTLGCTLAEAMDIINTVESSIPIDELKKVFWGMLLETRDIYPIRHRYRTYQHGVFYDVMGVRHFYPDIGSKDRRVEASAKRSSFNCLMQGGASSVFYTLCNRLLPWLREHGGWFAATVHDEAILYIPTQYAEQCRIKADEAFNSLVLGGDGGVPVRADFKIVNNWSEK